MYMTDMLLQMALQSSWQVPEFSQSVSQSGNSQSQGTSFQDLLAQRREDLAKPENGKTEEQKPQEGQEDSKDESVSSDSGQGQEVPLQALTLGTALLMDTPVVQLPQNVVQQPVQAEATTEILPTAVLPEQSGAVQTAGEPIQTEVLPQQTAPVQTQPVADTGADFGTIAAQQTGEAVAPAAAEPDTPGAQPQDLTQSAPQREQTQEPDQVTVNQWQTPLFRDVEATPVRVGDATVDMTAPAQEVQTALGDALKGAAEQGEQRLEIRLSPANLGTVVAEFTRSPEGALHVVLHAESQQTAKLLSDHAPALSLMLQDSSQGEVRVEVPQPQQNQTPWQQPDQDGSRQQQQQQQQQQQHAPRQEAESFLHQLRLGLVQMDEEAV